MKKYVVSGLLILLFAGGFFLYRNNRVASSPGMYRPTQSNVNLQSDTEIPLKTVVAQNLDTPWSLVFLPDQSILVTERPGTIVHIANGKQTVVANLEKVSERGEGGLLGIALHPDFVTNKYVYLYYTYSEEGGNTRNRVVRMMYEEGNLSNEQIIVDEIPGASNHNGGRIAFDENGFLFITTGDAQEPSQAQDINSLAGKILRVTDDGKPAPGNPYKNSVYSYGHRNAQGIVWDTDGRLWATEHGRSGVQSGLDELNLITMGGNYGWPEIEGDENKNGMIAPFIHSGGMNTWAPGGIAFLNGDLFFTGLRGSSLYRFNPQDQQREETELFKNEYGRIRDVVVGPDNMLYITTSNKDSRGIPKEGDDKIIRINPTKL